MIATCLISSILMAVAYIAAVIIKDKSLPDSISALVYAIPAGKWRWVWSVWLAAVTLMLAPALTSAAQSNLLVLIADSTIVCLAMTAAVPLLPCYHNKWHYALGISSGVLSQIYVALLCPWWLAAWLVFAALVVWTLTDWKQDAQKRFYGKGVFIAESVCAVTVYGVLCNM